MNDYWSQNHDMILPDLRSHSPFLHIIDVRLVKGTCWVSLSTVRCLIFLIATLPMTSPNTYTPTYPHCFIQPLSSCRCPICDVRYSMLIDFYHVQEKKPFWVSNLNKLISFVTKILTLIRWRNNARNFIIKYFIFSIRHQCNRNSSLSKYRSLYNQTATTWGTTKFDFHN